MEAVIFDFDGIIANTLQLNFEINEVIFGRYGVKLGLGEFIDYWVSPEEGKEGTGYFVKLKGIKEEPEKIRQMKRSLFSKYCLEKAEQMPGSLRLIELLKSLLLPIAVVSSNYRGSVLLVLQKFGIEKEFEFIIAAGDSPKHKPDPMPYQLAVKRFGLKPADVLVIEDSDSGVESAKAAGCGCIAVPNKFTEKGDFSKADLVIKSLLEIDAQLLKKF